MTTLSTDAPTTAVLPETLRALIDARLETIERMLLGRVPRPDRLAIARDVEAQIHEMLAARASGEAPARDDVLSVLADLDPPEAYLPEEGEGVQGGFARLPVRLVPPSRLAGRAEPARPAKASRTGLCGGLLGLISLACLMLFPLSFLVATVFESELALFVLGPIGLILTFATSLTALALAAIARLSNAWAVVGLVTGLLALLPALAQLTYFVMIVLTM